MTKCRGSLLGRGLPSYPLNLLIGCLNLQEPQKVVAVGKILIINNIYDIYCSYWRITGWDVPLNFSAIPTEVRLLISLKAELLRVPGDAPANRF